MNIVKTNNPELLGDEAIADIVSCFSQVGSAGSFVVLNLSCPNTEDGRTFEEPGALWLLLHALISEKQRLDLDIPVLVKFSPDMDDSNFEQNLEICEKLDVAGYVLTNTSKSREGLSTSSSLLEKYGRGGLSGRPIFNRSLHRVATAYRYVSKDRPIIGCGGIFSGADAYQMIRAGASLLELYTAFVYIGPLLCRTVLNELAMLLRRDGFGSITEAVGVDAS